MGTEIKSIHIEETIKDIIKSSEFPEETMMVGREGQKFEIKKGSIIQLQNDDEFYNSVAIVQYISEGIAYLFTPQFQQYDLYQLGIYNCTNVVPYTYDSTIGTVLDFQEHDGFIPPVNDLYN